MSANNSGPGAVTGRTLHLVDIENLLGQPSNWTPDAAIASFWQYVLIAGWQIGDSLVVASNPEVMKLLAFELFGFPHRSLCAWGPDAADDLLISAVPNEIANQFDRVVVGSGDHAFSQLVADLRGQIPTLVVVGEGLISSKLYRAAQEVLYLGRQPLDNQTPPTTPGLNEVRRCIKSRTNPEHRVGGPVTDSQFAVAENG